MKFRITVEDQMGYQSPYIVETKVTTEKGKKAWIKRTINQIFTIETVKSVEIEVVN